MRRFTWVAILLVAALILGACARRNETPAASGAADTAMKAPASEGTTPDYAECCDMESGDFDFRYNDQFNTEEYKYIEENDYMDVWKSPLSTFSIDVDTASYSNVRRYLNDGMLPPVDAVRIEELINYFSYDYPQPEGEAPFSVNVTLSECPWHAGHKVAVIGLQGRNVPQEELPPANLVFLLDVSGSMDEPDKLPLLKTAFGMLTDTLRPQDTVSIVVYAGAAGLVLPPTPGAEKKTIMDAIGELDAGGSTAGGEGIKLAYQLAEEHFDPEGNNRVILATDGDFNVGVSDEGSLTRLIEKKRGTGIYLSALGFGTGNIKDNKMESLADKGNGNYAYIDCVQEAEKVLVSQMGGTLYTIAKDVKIQVEFNPAIVSSYRLVGYENRVMDAENFEDDTKDAGELGSGHTVTAIYEIVPAATGEGDDGLKYQDKDATGSGDWMCVALRYKLPDSDVSSLLEMRVDDARYIPTLGGDSLFACAVAQFGMLLRDSPYAEGITFDRVLSQARDGKGEDREGYRAEFIRLIQVAKALDRD